jgi:2-polyprenyl-6-methoxyphenol hydroxylase-like FAD-dependent oxidoreductase
MTLSGKSEIRNPRSESEAAPSFGLRASDFVRSPEWDALVVGAGPAGSVTARELARRGLRVLLVDKANFPRPKVCGCCLNAAAVAAVRRLGLGHVLAGAVPLDRVIIAANGRTARLRLPRGLALSRETFDTRLVAEAVKAGVEFRPNTLLSRDAQRSAFHARITVVASGLAMAEAEPGSRIGAGVVVPAGAVPPFFAPGSIYMATGRGGYVGLVRVEDSRLDIAAAFDPAFVKSAGGPGPAAETVIGGVGWPVPSDLTERPWKGTPALTRRPARLAAERLFVVGDAAGYVEPFTGEGMAWAVMSAAALAPIAARATARWDGDLVREWEATHRRVVGRRQRVCRVVSWVLRSPLVTGLAIRALGVLPLLSRPVVAALNRPSPLVRGLPA